MANKLAENLRHEEFGFNCLHYTVSESSKYLKVKIINKKKAAVSVGIRTREFEDGSSAKPNKDFIPLDKVLNFAKG